MESLKIELPGTWVPVPVKYTVTMQDGVMPWSLLVEDVP
jgi:hypothetical protein